MQVIRAAHCVKSPICKARKEVKLTRRWVITRRYDLKGGFLQCFQVQDSTIKLRLTYKSNCALTLYMAEEVIQAKVGVRRCVIEMP